MSSLAALLAFLALLQVKHFVCDGLLQTSAMVEAKRFYGARLGLLHAGLHGVGSVVVGVLALGGVVFPLFLGVLDAVIHYHVDFSKENIVKRLGYTPANAPFWWAISADQMLHHMTYLLFAWMSFRS
ncbi:MAG: DUF3307 domain-containing protein [Alphaproteobacteria bacterium]|nr:DUF3307 domain-containing protein [Alphaproteobacteria bacterium]